MTEALPLHMLAAPLLIAVATVALMIGLSGAKTPRRLTTELGYKPEGAAVSMTLVRYVGGHPDLDAPVPKPYVLLTHRHLAAFARAWGLKLFVIPWNKVEAVTRLTREQMQSASVTVRGLRPGAIESAAPEAEFLRVRYQDARGWWQNVVFELAPDMAEQQLQEIASAWDAHRHEPDPEPDKAPIKT